MKSKLASAKRQEESPEIRALMQRYEGLIQKSVIADNNFQDAVGDEVDNVKAIVRSLHYAADSPTCDEPWKSMLLVLTGQAIRRLKNIEQLHENYFRQRAGK